MTKGALETLQRRGFIKQCTNLDWLKKSLDEGVVTFYAGFDPTGPSLHVGHMVPLFAMAHLARAGHKPIALVGGGTARIGDPSGKTEMRQILSYETIKANALKLKEQISRIVNFEHGLLLDNADWLANLNYIDFLRDIGRHFSVNRMLSFETYKMRMETGLSFIEFNYQLLQSYDFLVLFQKHGCSLQIGGDDQWGNIVSGTDLIRRVEGKECHGLTFPLITRADGKKMGKTEKGSIFMAADLCPPFDFFQYWRNVPDADVERFLLLFTFLSEEECRRLGALKDQEINQAKEVLASELTALVHGREEAENCLKAARAAFQKDGQADRGSIAMANVSRDSLKAGINVVDLFALTDLSPSKGETRRLVAQGGAMVSGKKVDSIDQMIDESWIDEEGELLLKAGKKRFFRLVPQ